MWDLPRPGLEPVSPALADGFLTTAPPGKPNGFILKRFMLEYLGVRRYYTCTLFANSSDKWKCKCKCILTYENTHTHTHTHREREGRERERDTVRQTLTTWWAQGKVTRKHFTFILFLLALNRMLPRAFESCQGLTGLTGRGWRGRGSERQSGDYPLGDEIGSWRL